jgi:hypothetical protein
MAFLYQGRCLDTVQRLHESVAAACPPVSGNHSLQCTPTSTQVDIVATDLISSTTYSSVLVPSQIPCDITLLDQTDFYWQLVGVLVAGFAIRALIQAFK